MQLFGLKIVGRDSPPPPSTRSSNPFDESFWRGVSATSRSGVTVTPDNSLQVAAVNAAVRIISETIASLPLILYRRLKDGGKERAINHPLYSVLHSSPNDWQTRMEWVELMLRHVLLRGNAYSIVRGNVGIESFHPIHPDTVTPRWTADKSKVVYEVMEGGKKTTYMQDAILHFRGPSDDGLNGKGPIQEARDVVGNVLALDQYQSYFYANGVRASGVLEHPNTLTDETAKRIAESFRGAYGGAANSGKVVVLEEGMKFNSVSMTPRDAEFLAVKKFSISEIARLFRVPPHMIGDLENATYSNIEQESISFVVNSIRPWTVRVEQALSKTLFSDKSEEYFPEFLLDGLLRGDVATRYAAYQIGLQNGFLLLNDIREKENMNPLEWGNISMIPLNMKPIASVDDLTKPPPSNTKPDEPAKKSNDIQFDYQLDNLVRSFTVLFEKQLVSIARRELTIADQEYKTSAEFDARVRKIFGPTHPLYIRSMLEPLTTALNSQLACLCGVYFRKYSPLDSGLLSEYISEYCGHCFDEVWPLAGKKDQIDVWSEGLKRTLRQSEATKIINKIIESALRDKG